MLSEDLNKELDRLIEKRKLNPEEKLMVYALVFLFSVFPDPELFNRLEEILGLEQIEEFTKIFLSSRK